MSQAIISDSSSLIMVTKLERLDFGVLLLNQRRGHIPTTEVLALLAQIKRMNFRLSAQLESDFLQQLQR